MQVILVKPVRKLGKIGETVSVADGFGRNYLVPQGYAIRATKDNMARFSSIQKEMEAKNAQDKSSAEKIALSLKGKHLFFILQSAADGRLFGSVTAKLIAQELSLHTKSQLNYHNILIDTPIKFNGVYDVQVSLHPEITANILVVIAKTDTEAQDALNEHKEGSKKKVEEATKEQELNFMESEAKEEISDSAAN
ncbi:MAG: 50S ribosomal protein L9 [Rickettsiales bacterium]|nr:50S ribosomal protein L9 [Rickettsiales bacterium]MCA0254213.1 50S ribosomal protein L9 [Pseudomonadota bacterium]